MLHSVSLHCFVLCCTLFHYTILYCTLLYCLVLYCVDLCCIAFLCTGNTGHNHISPSGIIVMVVLAFSSLARIGGTFSTIHSPPTRFFVVVVFFTVESSTRTLISLFRPGSVHSGSASLDGCGRMFPDRLCVSSFPDRFPHYAWTAAQ